MLYKNLYKLFSIIFIAILTACSSEPNDYLSAIDQYETDLAKIGAKNAISFAADFHHENLPEVTLLNFMSGPIPIHYKAYHQGLGIDVSKLNYTQSDWVRDIKADDKRIAELRLTNPATDNEHGHSH